MNFYIKYKNQTTGPFTEEQIIIFLQQGRYDDSVRISTDLTRWCSATEITQFNNIPLKSNKNNDNTYVPSKNIVSRYHDKVTQDNSFKYFLIFCLVAIFIFGGFIYLINLNNNIVIVDSDEPKIDKETLIADSLPAVYEKKQRAIGLVTYTLQDKNGTIETHPIGTAFAISKNKFVTNAHVAYGVKNGFEDWGDKILRRIIANEAKNKRKSFNQYLQELGARGIEEKKTELLASLKENGVRVRDIEIRLNHSNGESFRVSKVQVHPRYNPSGAESGEFDVAIFEIEGNTDCYFDIATSKELHALKAGTPVASAGFPMEALVLVRDLNINKPEASYASGDIKKITDFENKDGGNKYNKSITHSIPAAGGSSGSPIFTANGKVIAVLWGVNHGGNITELGRVPSGLLHNYAVRIDQIKQMTKPVSWENWIVDPTKNISLRTRENYQPLKKEVISQKQYQY
jgi:V8-like Glu-specific endopeptidase